MPLRVLRAQQGASALSQVRHVVGRAVDLGAVGEDLAPTSGDAAFLLATRRRDGIVHGRDDAAKVTELDDLGVRILRGRGRVATEGVIEVGGLAYSYGTSSSARAARP